MKKKLFLSLAGMTLLSLAVLQSCKKDDTTPPVISLGGSNPMTVTLNTSSAVSDPGGTASDDEDGTVTVSSNWSWGSNPNPDLADTYTITYTATDKAGNQAVAYRTVNVVNSAANLAGNYMVADTCGGIPFAYSQTIAASTTVNGRITFNRFADYSNNTAIYAEVTGTTITLPSQTANGIGSASENHQFNGTGAYVTSPNTIIHLNYVDNNLSASASTNCSAWFVKQ